MFVLSVIIATALVSDSFETGASASWTGEPAVTAMTYEVAHPFVYPIPTATHTNVLAYGGTEEDGYATVRREIPTGGTMAEAMFCLRAWTSFDDPDAVAALAQARTALALDAEGKPCVYCLQSDESMGWTRCSETVFADGTWAYVSLAIEKQAEDPVVRVTLNGVDCGRYRVRSADDIAAVALTGRGAVDDVVVAPADWREETEGLLRESGGLRLALSATGVATSLVETASHKELVNLAKCTSPAIAAWCAEIDAAGALTAPVSLTSDGRGVLTFRFADGGIVYENVTEEPWGLKFTILDSSLPDGKSLRAATVYHDLGKYVGNIAGSVSDDEMAIFLRDLDPRLTSRAYQSRLQLTLSDGETGAGLSFALIAGTRETALERVKAMLEAEVPLRSTVAGPWSKTSDAARESYFYATTLTAATADAFLAAAKRAGMGYLHIDHWYETLGHYDVRRDRFPNGLDDLVAIADKARTAGLKPSIHSLSGAISPADGWATPVAHSNLMVEASYTLAEPLTSSSTEVLVNERPIDGHDLVLTYNTKGNVLAVDGELISYTGVRRSEPYGFTGITRGYNQTTVSDHAAGRPLAYLRMRFNCFLAEPGSPLVAEIAERIASVYNAMGARKLYLDGLDAFASDEKAALVADALVARLDRSTGEPAIEASTPTPHTWPYRVTYQARDTPYYSPNRWAMEKLAEHETTGVKGSFLVSQMGWWDPAGATTDHRLRFLDEVAYYAAHNAAADAATAILNVGVTDGAPSFAQETALTTLGQYERFRRENVFTEATRAAMGGEKAQSHLFQDGTGAWCCQTGRVDRWRIVGDGVGNAWTLSAGPTDRLALRVENLYGLASNETAGVTLLEHQSAFITNTAYATSGPVVVASRTFAYPNYLSAAGTGGIGFWVTGDGSGTALDVELAHGSEYGAITAHHVITLDFAGRRYIQLLFRERDLEAMAAMNGLDESVDADYRTALRPDKLASVRLLVGGLPARHVLTLDVSDIKAFPIAKNAVSDATLTVGDETLRVPFTLAAGDFAELADGFWTHYDEQGEPLARTVGALPTLGESSVACTFAAKTAAGLPARAEVKLIRYAAPQSALTPLSSEQRAALAEETEAPVFFAPAKGFSTLPEIRLRPGERAALAVTVRGGLKNPVFTAATSAGNVSWTTNDAPPVIAGCATWSVTADDLTSAEATIELVKRYRTEGEDCVWNGGSGAWEDPSNWRGGVVPMGVGDCVDFGTAAGTVTICTSHATIGSISNGSDIVLQADADIALYDPNAFAGTVRAGMSGRTLTLAATASTRPMIATLTADNNPILAVPTVGTTGAVLRITGTGTVTKTGAGALALGTVEAATVRVREGDLVLQDGAMLTNCIIESRIQKFFLSDGANVRIAHLEMPTNGVLTVAGSGVLSLGDAAGMTLGRIRAEGVQIVKTGAGAMRITNFRGTDFAGLSIEAGSLVTATRPLEVLDEAVYHLDANDETSFEFTNGTKVARWNDTRRNGFYAQAMTLGSVDGRIAPKGVDPYPLSPYPTLVKAFPVRKTDAVAVYDPDVCYRASVTRPAVSFGSVGSDAADSASMSFSKVVSNLRDSFTVIRDYYSWKRGEILGNETSNMANSYYFRGGAFALVNTNYATKAVREAFISLDGNPCAYSALMDGDFADGRYLNAHVVVFSPRVDTYVDSLMQDRNSRTGGGYVFEQIGFDRNIGADERDYLTRHLMNKWLDAPPPVWTNRLATLTLAAGGTLSCAAETALVVSNLVGSGSVSGAVSGIARVTPQGLLRFGGTVAFAPEVTIDISNLPSDKHRFAILEAADFANFNEVTWTVVQNGQTREDALVSVEDATLIVRLPSSPSIFYLARNS